MGRSYKRLWHKLIDLDMSKTDLRRKAGITTNALAQLGRDEPLPLRTLEKICNVLNCPIEEIVEIMPDSEGSPKKAYRSRKQKENRQ